MRDTYYQSVGNPVQLDRLPATRPTIAFRGPLPSEGERWSQIGEIFVLSCGIVLLILLTWRPPGWSWLEPFDLIGGLLVLCGGIVHAVNTRRAENLWHPVLLIAIAVLTLNHQMPWNGQIVLLSLMMGLLTFGLGWHGSSQFLVTPVSRATVKTSQNNWNEQLFAYSLIAAIVTVGALGVRDPIFRFAIVTIPVIPVFARVPQGLRQSKTKVLTDCVLSWLTYQPLPLPGLWQSPMGSRFHRAGIMMLAALLTTIALIRMPDSPLAQLVTFGMEGLRSGDWRWGLMFLVVVVLPVLLPVVVAVSLVAPMLLEAAAHQAASAPQNPVQTILDDIRNSADPTERNSIYLGRVVADGSPVLVPRQVFGEHAHGLGDSGGGKTSLFLCPLIEQLGRTGDCSIIVIDNKADTLELFASLQVVAERVRQEQGSELPLKVFSNQGDKASFAFNPMMQPFWDNFDLFTRTDIICGANGLTYGSDYGQGYYSSANAAVLYHALKTFPHVTTFAELAECLKEVVMTSTNKRELHPEIKKAGVHVMEVMKRLAACQALNITSTTERDPQVLEQAIDFTKVFAEPQLHYFHLSATLSPSGAPEIARLVTYMLLAAATQTERRVPVFLVIDEFQRMVASNLEYMLQLARSMGVGIILANQSMEDLKKSATNLIPPIEANCRLRQWFSVSSTDDQERLINGSGLTVDYTTGRTVSTNADGKQSVSESRNETVVSRFTLNDVALTNDHPFRSFLHLKRGDGYAQYGGLPVIIQSDYHISEQEYQRRKSLPWPVLPGTLTPHERPVELETKAATTKKKKVVPDWTEEEVGVPSMPLGSQEAAAIESLFDSFRQTLVGDKQPRRQPS
ncbi:type IV secretory system conjugative DNA transfer family protein [Planctomicrobium sp. SH527]|uniref:type IV secretory system conjugative DNA transfer family protein n=1 Tax=Planctomicrobium sp. SH527 TaxID=3448123 RepID=UPI003F5C945D